MKRWRWLLLSLLAGCRGLHEERVSERLLGRLLSQHLFQMTLSQLDLVMHSSRSDEQLRDCELCVTSVQPTTDGKMVYCLVSGMHTGCVLAHEVKPGQVSLIAIERPLPTSLARALWRFIEGPQVEEAADDPKRQATVAMLTSAEDNEFTGAWAFFANMGSSAILSLANPAIGFSAQGGVRRWFNYYLIGGAGLEVESMPFSSRPFSVIGTQFRAELSMWEERFRRTFNLPGVTFLMSVTPLFAFGSKPAIGARGVIGVQMLRLGNAWTPIRLEIGYQQLVVNGLTISGARAGLMVGF